MPTTLSESAPLRCAAGSPREVVDMVDVVLRLSDRVYDMVRELSRRTGKGHSEAVAQAVENDLFLRQALDSYRQVIVQSASPSTVIPKLAAEGDDRSVAPPPVVNLP